MSRFFVSVLTGLTLLAMSAFASDVMESSPIQYVQQPKCSTACSTSWVDDVGMSFPVKPTIFKDYLTASGVASTPITNGVGYGAQFGRHYIVREGGATLGVIVSGNAFYSSGPVQAQVYQLGAYFTGRAYFNQSWREGLFAEVGAGPEVGGTSFNGASFQYQANLNARFGLGYNYRFNNDVSLGVSVLASPSITGNGILDGSRVLVNMLW